MRLFSILLVALICTVASAAEFHGTLLSYDQLMSLTPAKRMAYLKDYRKLMVMLEKQQIKYQLADNSPERNLNEQIAEMIRFFDLVPQAEADSSSGVTGGPPHVVPVWDEASGQWSCSASNTASAQYKFEPRIGTCVQLYSSPMARSGILSKIFQTQYTNYNPGKCPNPSSTNEGTVEVASPEGKGTVACIPVSSYRAMSPSRQDGAVAGEFLPEGSFKAATRDSTSNTVLGGLNNPKAALAQGGSPVGTGTENAAPPKAPANADVVEKPADTDKLAQDKSDAKPAAGEGLGDDSCKKAAEELIKADCPKISDKNQKAAIKKFRDDAEETSNSCIAGGFFSKYSTPKKTIGRCSIPHQFPPEPAKAFTKCPKKSDAMCNPWLFCVTENKDGPSTPLFRCEPVVVKHQANVTERCQKFVEDHTQPGSQFKVCDPKAALAYSEATIDENAGKKGKPRLVKHDFKAEWKDQADAFKADFKRRCMDKNFDGSDKPMGFEGGYQALFCNECKAIAKQVLKMNLEAINYGCAEKIAPSAAPASAGPASAAPAQGDAKTSR